MAVRLARQLGLRLEWQILDARRTVGPSVRQIDPVHSAMGEFEAEHLRSLNYSVGIDEPYQHFQFAGRADFVAWDMASRALLHIENRTRFPDLQEVAGSFNAKRAYLAAALGERLGIRAWASQTHVMAGLWSAEVLHSVRMRPATFRALRPDTQDAFMAWWSGDAPKTGIRTLFVALDPLASSRQRPFVGLDEALVRARPRHRGYADAALRLYAA